MDKSIVVAEVRKVNILYGKFVLKQKYIAHDETNDCNIGDTVRLAKRPLSKSKCWRLVEILERAK
jgi:small subunit ribosomal protein S17